MHPTSTLGTRQGGLGMHMRIEAWILARLIFAAVLIHASWRCAGCGD